MTNFTPDHARRATKFLNEARSLLNSEKNLVSSEIFDSDEYAGEVLDELISKAPNPIDKLNLNRMRDGYDRSSAYETAIYIYATTHFYSVLVELAAQLDILAEEWNSLQTGHNNSEDIYREGEGTDDDVWAISTAYIFRD